MAERVQIDPVTASTNCGKRHWLSGKKRAECRTIQSAINAQCSALKSWAPNLYDGCVNAINGNPLMSEEEYLCKHVGGDALLNYYGVERCGFTVEDSIQKQAFDELTKKTPEQERNEQLVKVVLFGVIFFLIVGIGFAVYRVFSR